MYKSGQLLCLFLDKTAHRRRSNTNKILFYVGLVCEMKQNFSHGENDVILSTVDVIACSLVGKCVA